MGPKSSLNDVPESAAPAQRSAGEDGWLVRAAELE